MAITDDLIAEWDLEESAGVTRVDAHGNNDLSETGGTVAQGTGRVGFGADFEIGSPAALSITDNAALSLGTDTPFTLGAWVNAEQFGTFMAIFGKWGNTGDINNIEYLFRVGGGGVLQFFVGNNSAFQVVTTTATIAIGTPSFVVAWHDPVADQLAVQIDNGTPETAAWSSGTFDGTGAFFLGDVNAVNTNAFDGVIDQAFMYKRVITADEKTFRYNNGLGRKYADLFVVPKAMQQYKRRWAA